ncbi:MAG: pyridoxal-dependent decarboxylase [Gemmatimonadaceae bacterium]
MTDATDSASLRTRAVPLEMSPEQFRDAGHRLVDRVADLLGSIRERPVTRDETPAALRALLGTGGLPEEGADPARLLDQTAELLMEHSLLNGHPKFFGYITSSPAPIGMLGDLLAAAVNPNCGSWTLSPMATLIEEQTVRWIAELIGYPPECGGLLVSGGNMANFVCLLAARAAKARKAEGSAADARLRVYATAETHTWIDKAATLFGLGASGVRRVPTDSKLRMDVAALRGQVEADRAAGDVPMMVIGTAGSVATGAVDPLTDIARVCRDFDLWFHVDGAYGALAAAVPGAPVALAGLGAAHSVAVDPHKWLYAPMEAGCALVRSPALLRDAFAHRPSYYQFDREDERDAPPNYYEMGPQNSRGFRALKVWLGLRQAGREGYARMIADDIRLAAELYRVADAHPELEAVTQGLSITTFRYVPREMNAKDPANLDALNALNSEILTRLQRGGEVFVSNAIVGGAYLLRACVVNFRTTLADIEALPEIVARCGREVHATRRPAP